MTYLWSPDIERVGLTETYMAVVYWSISAQASTLKSLKTFPIFDYVSVNGTRLNRLC